MINTTQVVAEIRHLIAAGTCERELLSTIARAFPEITSAELSQTLQVATTAAERNAVTRH